MVALANLIDITPELENALNITRCFYCDDIATTRDHIVPAAYGGSDKDSNLIDCCSACNNERGDMPVADFMRLKGVDKPVPTGMDRTTWFLIHHDVTNLTINGCAYCNRAFVATRDRDSRYCSVRHKQAAHKKRNRKSKAGN